MILPDGSRALTGFTALAAFDSNGDGKIDASDEIFASLKVVTGAGEMASLADVGIKSLNVWGTEHPAAGEEEPPSGFSRLTWEERVQWAKDRARAAWP